LRLNVGLGSGFFLVVAGFLVVVFLFGGVVVVVLPELFVVALFTEGFFAGCLDVGVDFFIFFEVFWVAFDVSFDCFAFGVVVVFFLGGIRSHNQETLNLQRMKSYTHQNYSQEQNDVNLMGRYNTFPLLVEEIYFLQ